MISDRASWIVIHEDMNGKPGEVIGRTFVPEGKTQDISIGISVRSATRTLYAVLYEDAGKKREFEGNFVDQAILYNGEIIVQSFHQRLDPK